LVFAASTVSGQSYPNKPIRFIVPFPAGGGTDFVARTVGQRMSVQMGQPVVVENRAGASGIIGVEAGARSPADGYTVLIAGVGELTINPSLFRKLPYDATKDLQAVSLLAKNPFVLVVNPAVWPVSDLAQLIASAKANPGKVAYASFGAGSIAHAITESFTQRAGLALVHVPYKGAAPAVQDLVAGQVSMMFVDYATAKGQLGSGRLRGVAVSTLGRHPALPAIPSLAEAGVPGFDAFSWIGSMVPAGTPADIVARLNEEIVKALASPEVLKHFSDHGVLPMTNTPEQHSAFVREEIERWGSVIRALNLSLD
jgi:tripartite-type tricarboxylate transporter receptor subunit TctC